MPLIKIDGQEIECKAGATVWQAADAAGVKIPNYCYHPGLSIAGNCRICLVEVQGMPKLTIACATQIFEAPPPRKVDGKYDMVVFTGSEKVKKAHAGVMEFLLINHPLDCPICDQAGECKLQQFAFEHGSGESRMIEPKVHHDKRVQLGPHVVFDGERCIKCTRCIRFCDEITKTKELGLIDRGDESVIATWPGRQLDNAYSGCTVDLCPVGALTLDEFRFASRVWFLKETDSICLDCARGCNINIATKENEVNRLTPRFNAQVNNYWMCDEGRLGFKRLQTANRPSGAVQRVAGESEMMSADAAFARLAGRAELARATPESSVIVGSARLSLEEMQALMNFAAACFPGQPVLAPLHERGVDDDLLIRKDRTPNRAGAEALGLKPQAAPLKPADLKEKKFLFIVREDLLADCATDAEKTALGKAIEQVPFVVVFDDRETPTTKLAHLFFPIPNFSEWEGLYINSQGLVQKTAAALAPPPEVKPVPELLARLAALFGISKSGAVEDMRAQLLITGKVPDFSAHFKKLDRIPVAGIV